MPIAWQHNILKQMDAAEPYIRIAMQAERHVGCKKIAFWSPWGSATLDVNALDIVIFLCKIIPSKIRSTINFNCLIDPQKLPHAWHLLFNAMIAVLKHEGGNGILWMYERTRSTQDHYNLPLLVIVSIFWLKHIVFQSLWIVIGDDIAWCLDTPQVVGS